VAFVVLFPAVLFRPLERPVLFPFRLLPTPQLLFVALAVELVVRLAGAQLLLRAVPIGQLLRPLLYRAEIFELVLRPLL